jgi:acetyl-CoA acyltransferase 1
MSTNAELSAPMAVDVDHTSRVDGPATPQDDAVLLLSSSQISMPSTEGPASPIDASSLLKPDVNDDRTAASAVIPSSLTPPPSSQMPTNAAVAAGHQLGYVASQQSGIVSPPATGLHNAKRDILTTADFTTPTAQQVAEATPEELRSYLQASMAEQAKLKMEAAHHKLQYNLMALQADEDAKRAAVEHEMTRREVDALRMAEDSRQARHELSAASESAHAKYLQLRVWYEQAVEEIESLSKRLKLAKKVIQQKEDELISLTDERDLLLNRIRENREHFHALCSPGGMFHTAATPKQQTASTPVQHRATPRQTPRSAQRDPQTHRGHGQEIPFDVLLKAATQENSSAPSTPLTSSRPAPRSLPKHTRNVQSMSSLPSTPIYRSRGGDQSGLLPSVDLVPQTEPSYRTGARFIPETPPITRHARRKSRESTISVEDAEETAAISRQQHNEELARQALSSFVSRGSATSSMRRRAADEEVYESQASQAASQMLRRDPRESFEVSASRDRSPRPGHFSTQTPAAAEKSAKLQAKLFAGLNKSGVSPAVTGSEKRKFSGAEGKDEVARREAVPSPTKKLRLAGGLRDPGRVGLGIRFAES